MKAGKARVVTYTVGAALISIGLWGILTETDSAPMGWAVWFGGVAIVHDGILIPCVLLLGALTTRLPRPYRRGVQVTLMVGGLVTLVSLPFVLGYGRRADNPSILPLAYGRNLAVVLAVIAGIAACRALYAVLWRRHGKHSSDGHK